MFFFSFLYFVFLCNQKEDPDPLFSEKLKKKRKKKKEREFSQQKQLTWRRVDDKSEHTVKISTARGMELSPDTSHYHADPLVDMSLHLLPLKKYYN